VTFEASLHPTVPWSPRSLLITYFLLGGMAVTTQTVVLRELLVVSLGNEVVIGLFLATWLLGVFLGATLGGGVSPRLRSPGIHFIGWTAGLCLLSVLSVTCIRMLGSLSGTDPGAYIQFFDLFFFSILLVAPLGFCVGFSFPVAARLRPVEAETRGGVLGFVSAVYINEALGALAGGILISFVLLGRADAYLILSLAASPLLFTLLHLARGGGHRAGAAVIGLLLIADLFLISPWGHIPLESLTVRARWRGFSRAEPIDSLDSRYQNLALGKQYEQNVLYTNGQLAAVFPEPVDHRVLAAHLICQHPDPRRLLIIGEAVSGLAQELLRYEISELVNVEMDRTLVAMITSRLPAAAQAGIEDPRLRLLFTDGRRTVRQNAGAARLRFDLLFINLPEPSTLLLNRYYSQEFFRDAAGALAPDGVIALRITSSENYAEGPVTRYTACIYHTLRSVFPHVVVAPGNPNMFFASRSPRSPTASPDRLQRRYRRSGVTPEQLGLIFKSLYPPEKTRFIRESLASRTDVSLNRDGSPSANTYFSRLLGWTSGGQADALFAAVERAGVPTWIRMVAMGWIVFFIWRSIVGMRRRSSRTAAAGFRGILARAADTRAPILAAAACGGMTGITLEILILYEFQIIHGYVYQHMGFVIALFMSGLPLGAIWSRRRLRRLGTGRGSILHLAAVLTLFIPLNTLFSPFVNLLSRTGTGLIGLPALAVATGFLVGALFPLALKAYLRPPAPPARAAGFIDAADHAGAAIGAFLYGALLVPVLGIRGVSLVLSITVGACVCGLLFIAAAGAETAPTGGSRPN